jgi:phage baseplate assembly protein W
MPTFLGKSLKFPFQPDGNGGLATVSEIDAVESSIRAIITSLKGSHVLEPWLGVPSFVFDPVTDPSAISILVREAILEGDDRVSPDTLNVEVALGNGVQLESGEMPLIITWSPKGSADTLTLNAGFRTL